MAKKKITVLADELLSGFLQEEGLELYHSEFVKEGRDWFLRIYIDKPEGEGYIGTEDCEKVSRFLSEKLDEADPVEQNYYLEVSSPGMDRELIKPEHYRRYVGSEVEIRLYKARTAQKIYKGFCRRWMVIPSKCRITTEKNGICSLLKSQRPSWQLFSKVGGK